MSEPNRRRAFRALGTTDPRCPKCGAFVEKTRSGEWACPTHGFIPLRAPTPTKSKEDHRG